MRLQLLAPFDLFRVCTAYYHHIEVIIGGGLIFSFAAYFALFLGDLGYDGGMDSASQHVSTTTVASVKWA